MVSTNEYTQVFIVGGGLTVIKSKNVVGYCSCRLHPGYMTSSTVKNHECIKKGCHFLKKYDDYGYWTAREQEELAKKKEKEAQRLQKQIDAIKQKELQKKLDMLKIVAEQLVGDLSRYDVHITKVIELSQNKYKIFYVTDDSGFCRYEFTKYVAENMEKSYDKSFVFTRMKNYDGSYATWYQWQHRPKH
jgi:hypothetical protein